MSFFSRSRSKGHYPHYNHGGGYYKKPHSSGGLLGKILELLMGRRHSSSHHHYGHGHGHGHGYYHRKSSWS